jgi:MFS family permease
MTGVVASAIVCGTIVGNLIGGWLTDKIGLRLPTMVPQTIADATTPVMTGLKENSEMTCSIPKDMVLFVIAAIVAGFAPNVWVLILARFIMGISVGKDPITANFICQPSTNQITHNGSANNC